MTLIDALREAMYILDASIEEKSKDEELSDVEIEDMIAELETIVDALQYELECRQEACHAASDQSTRRLEI